MKIFNRFAFLLSILMVVSMILAGCLKTKPDLSGSDAPSLAGPVSAINDPVAGLNQAQTYYTNGYKLQNDFMKLHQYSMGLDTKFRLGVADLFANKESCFSSVADTESQIASAVMSDSSLTEAAINALVTNSVSGEVATTACVDLSKQIADYVVTNRSAMFDARQAAYEAGLNYKAYLHDQIGNFLINDLVLAATNNQDIKDWLVKNNIGITDFTWFPTNDLQYVVAGSTAQATCNYYMSGTAITELDPDFVAKFAGHEADLESLYKATWNSNEMKCTLYRWAAFDKMLVVPTSSTTQDVYGTGEDVSAFPTPQE